jgi:hypothetical protein
MHHMPSIQPVVGHWYSSHGMSFEVVAVDDGERVIEIQHADGDLEEIEFDDWATRCRAGSLVMSEEAPENLFAVTDSEPADPPGPPPLTFDEVQGLHAAGALEDLDLFD